MHYVLSLYEIVKTRKFPLSLDGFRLAEPTARRGEGLGGGERFAMESVCCFFTLPLVPSSPRRRLYEPEAIKGGETRYRTVCLSPPARGGEI